MNINVVSAVDLSRDHLAAWLRILAESPSLDSPFFRPEYTQAVAAVRPQAAVAVLSDERGMVGFFPHERDARNVGRPVGGSLCDFQGVVTRPGETFDAEQLVRECGLAAWLFDKLLASQEAFRAHHGLTCDSPFIDLRGGFSAYLAEKRRNGSRTFEQAERKARKIERELGPLRFEYHAEDQRLFDTLLDWKVQQYRRLGTLNYLASAWTTALLESIRHARHSDFAGPMSVLFAGERPVAIHLGLRSRAIFHVWYPAYDPALAGYSPGLVFWLELLRATDGLGIARIDLGRGDERYKASLQTGAIRLAEGAVDLRPIAGSLRRGWICAREAVRATPLRKPGQAAVRCARRWFSS
jgi:CelD/BcsL family acetyltransferase involved in cellulose biosynthesis